VLARNIGKFFSGLRQPGKGLSLPTMHVRDDDLCAAFVFDGRPGSVLSGVRARQEYEVTIYSGTDSNLCDVVREGELLRRRVRTFTGTEMNCGEGN